VRAGLAFFSVLFLSLACRTPAPAARPTTAARPAATATATPDAAASALSLVPLRIDEAPLPPAEATPPGFAAGRATARPYATAEAAWKYVTLTFAVENRSTSARLVGIAGADPSSTNLAQAVLTTADGTRYKPVRSSTSLGLRSATSHALVTYPVLLRLPPGFRAAAESAGSLSVIAPVSTSLTFKLPSGLAEYGSLRVPAPANLSSKGGEDDVTRGMRSLMGGFGALDLAGVQPRTIGFPFGSAPADAHAVGATVSGSAASVTLVSVEATDPQDFEVRNRGWKQLTLSLQYRGDSGMVDVSAWLFGDDGVVYTGDAPSIGDFGRSLTAPTPSAMLLWDGRSAGAPGQSAEPRRAAFLVPKALQNGVLVLSGDVDATFTLPNLPSP
jgi:hypothetical protein